MCFRVGRSAFLAVLVIVGASAAALARASECVNLPSSTLHLFGIRVSMPEVQSVPAAALDHIPQGINLNRITP
jgi:hypothetical protein